MSSNGSTDDRTLDTLRARLRDRYAIDRQLGRGGMGAVYLARDLQLDRLVAIKVLPPEFATDVALRDRFLRETRMSASFSHPNIVPVFSVEDRDDMLAFAMGYVEGESVAERVKRAGPLSVKELVRLLQDIGYALAYAHGRGVVHRDIKPDNIMLERATGRALLMDFGISRTIAALAAAADGLTRVGEVVGTPEFMSPEQASGDTLDGRSDLYSLGLVAWFAATARLAISGESTQKVLVKQLTESVPPIGQERSDLPQALAAAIDRCTRKDPAERFASADELVETLDVAKLAGPEVPLPIRLFAEEASQAGLVLIGGILMGVLLYIALGSIYDGNLDIILPVVLFAAVVYARLAQTVVKSRRLALRGFGVAEIQRGINTIVAERDAERAQLRADPTIVSRKRRQLTISILIFASTFGLNWYVMRYQRVLLKPGWYGVRLPGTIILYSAAVMRGMTLVNVFRTPLRRSLGERMFALFWTGAMGRALLQLTARGVNPGTMSGRSSGTTSTVAAPPKFAAAQNAAPPAPDGSITLGQLHERVTALEQWQHAQTPPNR